MFRITWRSLVSHKLRTLLTSISIVLGVAMISGTLTLTDQISRAFDEIFATANRGTDTVVRPKASFGKVVNQQGQQVVYLKQDLLSRVAAAPGVSSVSGSVEASAFLVYGRNADGLPKVFKSSGGPAFLFTVAKPPFEATKLIAGHFPSAPGEIAVDQNLADRAGVHAGQRAQIAVASGLGALVPVTISAIVRYPSSTGGTTIMEARLADVQTWSGTVGKLSTIAAAARPGVSQAELTRSIAGVLRGQPVEVKTGKQDAKDQAADINKQIGTFLTPALLIFGIVALFVGAFIIFNTFSITVAQRVREFAMLRTLGAMRSQVRRAVLLEALGIGILASVIGLVGGFAIARGITALFDLAGFGLPTARARLTPQTVIAAIAVGIGVTVLAALGPARRATKIAPIAALREGAVLPRSFLARWAWAIGAGRVVLGAIAIAIGFSSSGSVTSRLGSIGVGAFFIFGAVAVLARYVVRPIASVVGRPLEVVAHVVGRLARENATRNVSRTAVTSAALMIGLGLVVFVSIFASGIKGSIREFVNGSITADGIVSNSGFGRLPTGVPAALATTTEVTDVAPARSIVVRIAGKNYGFTGVPARAFGRNWKLKWTAGSQASFDGLDAGQVVVDQQTAADRGWRVGTSVAMRAPDGRAAVLRIAGLYDTARSTAISGFIGDDRAYERLSTTKEADFLLFRIAGGEDTAGAVKSVNRSLQQRFPIVQAQTRKEFTNSTADQLNPLIYIFYVLLALSVVISLFGIVNTLVLSIFERTREIGMLRAVGITRRQMRRMVRFESVITATIGGVLGLIVGIFFGWVMIKGLEDQGLVFSLPIVQIAVFFLLAVVAGVLSAILPARRAARMDVLQALQYE